MNQIEFRNICILSGTDYNINSNPEINLKNTLIHFENYKKNGKNGFYEWVLENTNYIEDIELLNKINKMFVLDSSYKKLQVFNNIDIINSEVRQNEIENIMKEEDFIFCKKSY
jgi:hypothetical protein